MNFKNSLALISCVFITGVVFAQTGSITQTSLPLQFNTGNPAPNGGPSTVIFIQGKEVPILLDTGAKKSELVLSEHALKNIQVKYTGKEVCFKGMNGKICEKEFIIPEVKIGDFVLENVKGTVMEKLWGGHDEFFKATEASRNGVIGLALLSKFNLLLDYPSSKAILVKPGNKPIGYDLANWVPIPFHDQLLTPLKLNGKLVTVTWDTGAIPSDINQTIAQSLKQTPCPKDSPYKESEKCLRVIADSLLTTNNQKLPNTWFNVQAMPSYVPFDGLMGSNFYQNNLVYFDFDNRTIYVKP